MSKRTMTDLRIRPGFDAGHPPPAQKKKHEDYYPKLENFGYTIRKQGRNLRQDELIKIGDREFEFKKVLGSGGFGIVLLTFFKNIGEMCALKLELETTTLGKLCKESRMQERIAQILPETPLIYACDKVYDENNEMHMFIAMELMQGSVHELLMSCLEKVVEAKRNPSAPNSRDVALQSVAVIFYACREMARQIKLLEEEEIFHIDIKFSNMLYSAVKSQKTGEMFLRISLSDFGFACDTTPESRCYTRASLLPPEWKFEHTREIGDARDIMKAQMFMVGESAARILGGEYNSLREPRFSGRLVDFFTDLNVRKVYALARALREADPKGRPNGYDEFIKACEDEIKTAATISRLAGLVYMSLRPFSRRLID